MRVAVLCLLLTGCTVINVTVSDARVQLVVPTEIVEPPTDGAPPEVRF